MKTFNEWLNEMMGPYPTAGDLQRAENAIATATDGALSGGTATLRYEFPKDPGYVYTHFYNNDGNQWTYTSKRNEVKLGQPKYYSTREALIKDQTPWLAKALENGAVFLK